MISKQSVVILVFMLAAVPLITAQPANTTNLSNQSQQNETNLTENESSFSMSRNVSNTSSNVSNLSNQTTNASSPPANGSNHTNETNMTETTNATEQNVSANVSTVILTSTENYPDTFIASSAAAKTGSPIILTPNDTISNETQQTIQALHPDTVVVIGGPQVMSTNVSDALSTTYNVTRLWGFTRYGTSVEVAEYFWPEGANQAVLAQNDLRSPTFQVLSGAADLAKESTIPLYETPTDAVPAITAASLQELGVRNATVIGTNVTSQYRSQLVDANVSIGENITANTSDQVQAQLQNRSWDRLNQTQNLVIVASDDYHYSLIAANALNATTLRVTNKSELNPLMTRLNSTNNTRIQNVTVVGPTQFGQNISTRLKNAGFNVTAFLGPVNATTRLNDQFVLHNAKTFEQASARWQQTQDQVIQQNQSRVRTRLAGLIVRTQRMIQNDTPVAANQSINRAARLFQSGEYRQALQATMQARSTIRLHRFEQTVGTPAFEQEVMAETQSLSQFEQQLNQVSPTFATAFQQAPRATQFWIVTSVRNIPQQQAAIIYRETARTLEENESLLTQFERARDRVRSGNITVNQTNQTQMNATNQSMNETNMTNSVVNGSNTTNTSGTVNQSNTTNQSNVTPVAGQRFGYDTRCMTGNATNELSISSPPSRNVVMVLGTVVLPTPNYNATSDVNVDPSQRQVTVHVHFQNKSGVGIQCVGEGRFIQEVNVTPGNWTVGADVAVGNETVSQSIYAVQVPGQETNTSGVSNLSGNSSSNTT